MSDTIKHYLVSSALTFLSGFIPAFAAVMAVIPMSDHALTWGTILGALSGAASAGIRAGLKMVAEAPLSAAIGVPTYRDAVRPNGGEGI